MNRNKDFFFKERVFRRGNLFGNQSWKNFVMENSKMRRQRTCVEC
jgi:hypothetical protein